jgi:hypothetical protein
MGEPNQYLDRDDQIERGLIAESEWYAEACRELEEAYLRQSDPVRQCGLDGGLDHWERRRRVIVEAIDHDGTLLDIGCANGLLIETVAAWAAERGFRIEPFGLDLSPGLAALARSRLPAWADRVFAGNAIDWTPPRRFDFVRTELEYVPRARRQNLVARLRDGVVAPSGRLIVCAYRPRGQRDAEPIGDNLRGWGATVMGEAVAVDPCAGGAATRVVWIDGQGS